MGEQDMSINEEFESKVQREAIKYLLKVLPTRPTSVLGFPADMNPQILGIKILTTGYRGGMCNTTASYLGSPWRKSLPDKWLAYFRLSRALISFLWRNSPNQA
jgi:hypothetical protein